eukprot:jgi/Chlat1/4099/Chrsp26S08852
MAETAGFSLPSHSLSRGSNGLYRDVHLHLPSVVHISDDEDDSGPDSPVVFSGRQWTSPQQHETDTLDEVPGASLQSEPSPVQDLFVTGRALTGRQLADYHGAAVAVDVDSDEDTSEVDVVDTAEDGEDCEASSDSGSEYDFATQGCTGIKHVSSVSASIDALLSEPSLPFPETQRRRRCSPTLENSSIQWARSNRWHCESDARQQARKEQDAGTTAPVFRTLASPPPPAHAVHEKCTLDVDGFLQGVDLDGLLARLACEVPSQRVLDTEDTAKPIVVQSPAKDKSGKL